MAGRSVGHITVTVDADTAKLKAQLTVAGRQGGQAYADEFESQLGDVDGRELLARLKAIALRAEEELDDIEVRPGLKTSELMAELRELKARLDAEEMNPAVEPELDREALEAALTHLDVVTKAHKAAIDLGAEVDNTELRSAIASVEAIVSAAHADVDIGADVDDTEVTAALAKVKAKVAKGSDDAGKSGGQSFMKGFSSGIFDQEKLVAGAIAFLGSDIAQLLQGALGAATAVVSSAFQGLVGGIGAAAPLIAGLVPAVGATVIGFQGMGDALKAVGDEFNAATAEGRAFNINAEDIQTALSGLAPAAQEVVQAFADMQPQLQGIQQDIQGALFEGMAGTFRALGTNVIPDIGEALTTAAGLVNDFVQDLADAAKDIDFSGLMDALAPAVEEIGDAIVSVFETIGPFLEAATPAAKELADSLAAGAESLQQWVSAHPTEIQDFLLRGVESLRQWGDLLKTVGDALATLFAAGAETGDSFVQSLTDIIARFDAWMESAAGQTALAEFFQTARDTMSAMLPLLEGLQGLFQNLVSPDSLARFTTFMDSLGRALPFLGQLLDISSRVSTIQLIVEAFARIGEALQPAIPAVQELADALSAGLVTAIDALTPLVDGLGPLVGQLADAITPLIPQVVDLAASLVEMITPSVLEGVSALMDVITELSPIISDLLEAFSPLVEVIAGQMVGALEIATPLLQLMADYLSALQPIIEALKGPIEAFAGALNLTTKPLQLVGGAYQKLGGVVHDVFTDDVQGSSVIAEENAAKQEEMAAAAQKVQDVLKAIQIAAYLNDLQKQKEATDEAAAAHTEFQNMLTASGNAAMDAGGAYYAASGKLNELDSATRNLIDPIGRAAQSIADAKVQAEGAATAADALREAWDLLTGGAVGVTEASIAQAEAYAAVAEQLQKAQAGEEGYALTLDLSTQAGRDNQQVLLDSANATKDYTAALVESGDASDSSIQKYKDQRNALILQAQGFGLTKKQAQAYVTEGLGLIPPQRLTKLILQGQKKAKEEVDGFKGSLDRLPGRKAPRVDAPGAREAKEQVGGLMTQIGKVRGAKAPVQAPGAKEAAGEVKKVADEASKVRGKDAPVKAPGATQAEREVKAVNDQVGKVKGKDAPIHAPGATDATTDVKNLNSAIANLSGKSVSISASGADSATQSVRNLKSAIDSLYSKTVTVTVRQVGAAPHGQHGGQAPYGGMLIGEAGAEFYRMGATRGLATSPTLVPGGTMVESAALTAALLRAQAQPTAGQVIQKQVNNTLTVMPNSADPAAVATQVMNRAAAMAGA